jgi:3-hydroxyisobutyrate dehydrogenase-like beta-hydroxyacid dehydrogenase
MGGSEMKVTVIGLGAMGSAIAKCLVRGGIETCVWNRTPDKAAPLAALGARVAATPGEAVAASPLVIVCIKSHRETAELMEALGGALAGKTVCDMSTGDTGDAERLVAALRSNGADFMLGMINAYPSGIGEADTTILTVGSAAAWAEHGDVIRRLGGKSARVGETPAALAALFAGLFTARQGFMFGMIYGALVCQKAGIPMQVYADQLPATLKLVHDYHALFAKTVPAGEYDDAEASLKTYALAQEDALKSFRATGAPAEFLELMYARTDEALKDGLGDKQLTVLVERMG